MKPGPGKFEGCADLGTAERLYEASLDGVDDEVGTVEEGLWVGLLGDAIVDENSSGFFSYEILGSEAEARAKFEEIARDYEEVVS